MWCTKCSPIIQLLYLAGDKKQNREYILAFIIISYVYYYHYHIIVFFFKHFAYRTIYLATTETFWSHWLRIKIWSKENNEVSLLLTKKTHMNFIYYCILYILHITFLCSHDRTLAALTIHIKFYNQIVN